MKNEILGYRLIKEYPNSRPLGFFEKYTTGELSRYPEFWQPVYNKVWINHEDMQAHKELTKEMTQEERVKMAYFFWNNFSYEGYEEWKSKTAI